MDEEICTHDGIEDASDCPHATQVEFALEDADISNPPDEVTWYPINDPSASWNLPK